MKPLSKEKMQKWLKEVQDNPLKFIEQVGRKTMSRNFRQYIPLYFDDPRIWENDLTQVTANEIIGKIREFLKSEPKEVNYSSFLYYMAYYPVSMCKRSVSPLLKKVIGFHYGFLGIPPKNEDYKGIDRVSMEELAEIFGRSKATIHECIKETELEVKDFEEEYERSIELDTKAERELIEERKACLREEKGSELALGEKTSE